MGKQSVATEDDEPPITIWVPRRVPERNDDQHSDDNDGSGQPLPRRRLRERRPAKPFQYSDLL